MAEMMIWRVAQTLHELTLKNTGESRGAADMMEDARAIVAAMREPTEVMGVDAVEYEAVDGKATSRNVWRAMIDAALAEEG